MTFRIAHRTVYRYSRPVFLDPHEIRLRPRCDWHQRIIDFAIDIAPEPAGIARNVDADGNATARVWFSGSHAELRIEARAQVAVDRANPFEFVLASGFADLPADYGDAPALAPYLPAQYGSGPVVDLARAIRAEAGEQTLPFLSKLNRHIYQSHRSEIRLEGGPLAAEETLARGQGACRDLAVLFMEACRAAGLATRFVSGYQVGDPQNAAQERHMHAWAEVYLPGGGWRGYDPSRGLAVADGYIAVATGAEPAAAQPIVGYYRGEGVVAELAAAINIEDV